MFRKLLKSRTTVAAPAIEPGRRVYAVGDVHGCRVLLDQLLAAINDDISSREPAAITLIFLGDLIDRGPDSRGVVERVRQCSDALDDVRLLLGNHEEVFLAALDGDARALKLFCRIGGRETALSYGISAADYESSGYDDLHALLVAAVPSSHRALLNAATNMEVIGDYAFVHAGVNPSRVLVDQRESDLRWIREPFLDHAKRLEKMIVHGHTIADEVEYRSHRIGVDTGAFLSGRLSSLALEDDRSWVIAVG